MLLFFWFLGYRTAFGSWLLIIIVPLHILKQSKKDFDLEMRGGKNGK